MPKRPTSVNIIAWFIIVISLTSLVWSYCRRDNALIRQLMAESVLPIALQYGIHYGGLVLKLVAAIAMLRGLSWGRLLYVGWGVIGLVIGVFASPSRLAVVPGMLVFVMIAWFLFLPPANAFFSRRPAANDA